MSRGIILRLDAIIAALGGRPVRNSPMVLDLDLCITDAVSVTDAQQKALEDQIEKRNNKNRSYTRPNESRAIY